MMTATVKSSVRVVVVQRAAELLRVILRLGAYSARVWFPDLDDILDVCGAVDIELPPQPSAVVEAFSCGGALPLRSRIPHRLLGE
jgi:hypothetical protein